jgi:hypothetical protein
MSQVFLFAMSVDFNRKSPSEEVRPLVRKGKHGPDTGNMRCCVTRTSFTELVDMDTVVYRNTKCPISQFRVEK